MQSLVLRLTEHAPQFGHEDVALLTDVFSPVLLWIDLSEKERLVHVLPVLVCDESARGPPVARVEARRLEAVEFAPPGGLEDLLASLLGSDDVGQAVVRGSGAVHPGEGVDLLKRPPQSLHDHGHHHLLHRRVLEIQLLLTIKGDPAGLGGGFGPGDGVLDSRDGGRPSSSSSQQWRRRSRSRRPRQSG